MQLLNARLLKTLRKIPFRLYAYSEPELQMNSDIRLESLLRYLIKHMQTFQNLKKVKFKTCLVPSILDKEYSTCTFAVGQGNRVKITTSLSLLTLTNIQTHVITEIILQVLKTQWL